METQEQGGRHTKLRYHADRSLYTEECRTRSTSRKTEEKRLYTDALMTGRGTGGVRRGTAGNEKLDKTQEGNIFKIKEETEVHKLGSRQSEVKRCMLNAPNIRLL